MGEVRSAAAAGKVDKEEVLQQVVWETPVPPPKSKAKLIAQEWYEQMNGRSDFSSVGRGLLYCAAFALTVAGLQAASSVVIPFLVALFVTIVSTPLLNALRRKVPHPVALAIVLLLLGAVFVSVPLVVGGSLQQMLRSLPTMQEQVHSWESEVAAKFQAWGLGESWGDLATIVDPSTAASWLGRFLNGVLQALKDGVLVLIMVAFMLTEASWFSQKLSLIDKAPGDRAERVSQILKNVRRYVGIKTVVSLATGLCIWLGLLAMGVDYAIAWGVIAFLLNYIPSIGSVIAGIPPVLLGLVQYGPIWASAIALLYLAVNTIWGSVIEPRLQGRGLGLSPLIVFLSLMFWGWVLGPVGMLLSAPLTMIVKIALEEFPETRWIAIMLGGKPPQQTEIHSLDESDHLASVGQESSEAKT